MLYLRRVSQRGLSSDKRLYSDLPLSFNRFDKFNYTVHVCLLVIIHCIMTPVCTQQKLRTLNFFAHPFHIFWVHGIIGSTNDKRGNMNIFQFFAYIPIDFSCPILFCWFEQELNAITATINPIVSKD